MKIYELLVLIKPGVEQESLKSLYKDIEDTVAKHKGTVEHKEELGKKRLSYEIKKNKEGIYYILRVKISPADVKALDNDLKLNESIIRIMFTLR